MRLLSVLSAIFVMVVLYLFVFEREMLTSLAGAGDTSDIAAEATTEEAEGPDEAAVSVVAMTSEAGAIDGAVVLRGRTEADRQVEVRSETSGLVINAPLRKGAFVEEGDVLCHLDPGTRESARSEAEARLAEARTAIPTAEARVAEANARLAEAEINDNAASRLSEDGFASETRVAATTAEAALARAERELQNLEIRAPFAGALETDTAERGALLQPGLLCATILQLDPIRVVGFVPETLVDRVSLGAQAGARLASGREVLGIVTFISRSADPATRTFRVDIEVSNTDLAIRDGQSAEIAIQSAGQTAHLLPQSALTLDDEGRLGVRLVEDGRAAFAPVSVVRDSVDGIYVTGLDQTVEVIVVGQEFVTDGVPVTPTYREVTQ